MEYELWLKITASKNDNLTKLNVRGAQANMGNYFEDSKMLITL